MKKITITFSREQLQLLFRILSAAETALISDKTMGVMVGYFKKKLMIRLVKHLADEGKQEINLKLDPAEVVALQVITGQIDLTQTDGYTFTVVYKINEAMGAI